MVFFGVLKFHPGSPLIGSVDVVALAPPASGSAHTRITPIATETLKTWVFGASYLRRIPDDVTGKEFSECSSSQ